jgi:hypothetical protein
MQTRKDSSPVLLAVGDLAVMALITVAGFARHGELSGAGLRLFSTFIPLCAAWVLVAPWLGVYEAARAADWRQVWRPLLAAFLAAPMAGLLRGLWLGEAVMPIFVLVIAAFSGLGILAWRMVWALLVRWQVRHG